MASHNVNWQTIAITSCSVTAGGTLYVSGSHPSTSLVQVAGSPAIAIVPVSAGGVTSTGFVITNPGSGFVTGDLLSAPAVSFGGNGVSLALPDANAAVVTLTAATRPTTANPESYTVTGLTALSPNLLYSRTGPSALVGFGVGHAIVTNGTGAFSITVGSSASTSGSFTLPMAANGWACAAVDITNPASTNTKQTASTTTSVTLTNYNTMNYPTAWGNFDVINVSCFAY